MPLLVRTPAQMAGESPLGFLLRASELNGYETPWRLFRLAGIGQSGMLTNGLDMKRVAATFGRNATTLCGYRTGDGRGNWAPGLAGHAVAPKQLRTGRPHLCPECVNEHGFIPAWADLAQVDACPRHGKTLIASCPECGKPLSWFRPGLLTCRCGFDLTGTRGEPIAAAHAALLGVVADKVMGATLDEGDAAARAAGLPVEHLSAMTLRGLLRLVQVLGRLGWMADGARTEGAPVNSAAAVAAHVLSDWPRNLHVLLRALASEYPQAGHVLGLRKQFEKFYGALLKGESLESEFGFVRQAFVEFGHDHWGYAQLDSKLRGAEPGLSSARYASLSETARHLGVRRITARRLLERELATAHVFENETERRYVVDTATLKVPRKTAGKSYGEREAARRLGIPVSVLHGLRRTGHLATEHLGGWVAAFHEADLVVFEERVAALAMGPFRPATEPMSLQEVLRMKFSAGEGKSILVGAALDGRLPVVGARGTALADLLVERPAAQAMVDALRAAAFGNALTGREVATRLGCDPMVVPELVQCGHLEGEETPGGLRISKASVERFAGEFRCVAALAKARGTSSRKLTTEFQKAGIPLLMVARGHGMAAQPFVSAGDVEEDRTRLPA